MKPLMEKHWHHLPQEEVLATPLTRKIARFSHLQVRAGCPTGTGGLSSNGHHSF